MFDVPMIQANLFRGVGIRPALDPDLPVLDPDLQASESGLYLNEIEGFDLGAFMNATEYYGMTEDEFNARLVQTQQESISEVMFKVFTKPSYIDRNFFYSKASGRVDEETGIPQGYAGFRIRPSDTKNIGFKITRVRLEYNVAGGPVDATIFLFNSFNQTFLEFKLVTISELDQVEELNWVVNSTKGDYKGEYYLLISFDGQLTPYKRNYNDANRMNYFSQLEITPVNIPQPVSANIFDPNRALRLAENTGMNPDITVYYDYTDLILQNKHLFWRAIQLQWAVHLMGLCVTSMRSNRDERRAKEILVQMAIYTEGQRGEGRQYIRGARPELKSVITSITEEIEKLTCGYEPDGIYVVTQE